MSRRRFLAGSASLIILGVASRFARASSPAQSSPDLATLYAAAGFDPWDPNSAIIAHIADLHFDHRSPPIIPTVAIDDRLVNAINGLDPLPDELVVNGDLAFSNSINLGSPRHPEDYERARGELGNCFQELTRFHSNIRRWTTAGNHDTDALEINPDLMMEVSGTAPYARFDAAGVPVFTLNGRHSGDLDPTQILWFKEQIAGIPPDQEIVIFVHQPSFSRVSAEQGVKREVVPLLAGRGGTVWVFSGHDHRFGQQCFVERGTLFVQTMVTAAHPTVWSDGRNPGFELVCLSNGRLKCRISRDLKLPESELLTPPNPSTAQPFVWPFEQTPYPILALEEGTYPRQDYEVSRVSGDTGSWLSYVGEMTYSLPLGVYGGKATDVLVLGGTAYPEHLIWDFRLPDGDWIQQVASPFVAGVATIPIPASLQNEPEVHFRVHTVESRGLTGLVIGGWGLGSIESRLNSVEKWMSHHFKQIRNVGKASVDAVLHEDGLRNLVKYAYGLDPGAADKRAFNPMQGADAGGLPVIWKGTLAGSRHIGVRFPRRRAATDPGIRYLLEESNDLLTWQEVASPVQQIMGEAGDWEDVIFSSPMLEVGACYDRLNVALTAPLLS